MTDEAVSQDPVPHPETSARRIRPVTLVCVLLATLGLATATWLANKPVQDARQQLERVKKRQAAFQAEVQALLDIEQEIRDSRIVIQTKRNALQLAVQSFAQAELQPALTQAFAQTELSQALAFSPSLGDDAVGRWIYVPEPGHRLRIGLSCGAELTSHFEGSEVLDSEYSLPLQAGQLHFVNLTIQRTGKNCRILLEFDGKQLMNGELALSHAGSSNLGLKTRFAPLRILDRNWIYEQTKPVAKEWLILAKNQFQFRPPSSKPIPQNNGPNGETRLELDVRLSLTTELPVYCSPADKATLDANGIRSELDDNLESDYYGMQRVLW